MLAEKSTNVTSDLRTHRNRCIQKQIHDVSQTILGANYSAKETAEMSTNQFNSDVSIKELCIMIVVHEYLLSIVNHLYFKRFCCSLCSLNSLSDIWIEYFKCIKSDNVIGPDVNDHPTVLINVLIYLE
ncbi:hypothetical protein LINGRAHAP2_LOCUS7156 [Linum grandiflorum]